MKTTDKLVYDSDAIKSTIPVNGYDLRATTIRSISHSHHETRELVPLSVNRVQIVRLHGYGCLDFEQEIEDCLPTQRVLHAATDTQ